MNVKKATDQKLKDEFDRLALRRSAIYARITFVEQQMLEVAEELQQRALLLEMLAP